MFRYLIEGSRRKAFVVLHEHPGICRFWGIANRGAPTTTGATRIADHASTDDAIFSAGPERQRRCVPFSQLHGQK
jgi:hypothetical protein